MATAVVEPGGKVRLPAEWVADWPSLTVEIERTPEGILLRPRFSKTWEEVFAHPVRAGAVYHESRLEGLGGDDVGL